MFKNLLTLIKKFFTNFCLDEDINKVIVYKEIGLSLYALENNWNINCILDKYSNLDYRKINQDISKSSRQGDPYYPNSYFGKTIDKYDVVFFKNNRF